MFGYTLDECLDDSIYEFRLDHKFNIQPDMGFVFCRTAPRRRIAASGLELNFFPACFFDLGLFGVLFLRYLRKGKSEQKVGRSVPAAVAPRSFRRLALTLAILRSGVLPR